MDRMIDKFRGVCCVPLETKPGKKKNTKFLPYLILIYNKTKRGDWTIVLWADGLGSGSCSRGKVGRKGKEEEEKGTILRLACRRRIGYLGERKTKEGTGKKWTLNSGRANSPNDESHLPVS